MSLDWWQAAGTVAAAIAAFAAVVVGGIALRIASAARDAEKAQAQLAQEAIDLTREQQRVGSLPFVTVDSVDVRPGTMPPRLTINLENKSDFLAVDVHLKVGLARALAEADDDPEIEGSRWIPVLARSEKAKVGVPLLPFIDGPVTTFAQWRAEWLLIGIEYQSVLGARVTSGYWYQPSNGILVWGSSVTTLGAGKVHSVATDLIRAAEDATEDA